MRNEFKGFTRDFFHDLDIWNDDWEKVQIENIDQYIEDVKLAEKCNTYLELWL